MTIREPTARDVLDLLGVGTAEVDRQRAAVGRAIAEHRLFLAELRALRAVGLL